MTSVDMDKPLTLLVAILFQNLEEKKVLQLSYLKENALKDCVATSSETIAKSFIKDTLIQSFVSSGILDDQTKTCSNMNGIFKSFKINWDKTKGEKKWFVDQFPAVLS